MEDETEDNNKNVDNSNADVHNRAVQDDTEKKDDYNTTANKDTTKLNLLDVMQSSPFKPPPRSQNKVDDVIDSTTLNKKPNLSELLSSEDIFAQSWAGPDVVQENANSYNSSSSSSSSSSSYDWRRKSDDYSRRNGSDYYRKSGSDYTKSNEYSPRRSNRDYETRYSSPSTLRRHDDVRHDSIRSKSSPPPPNDVWMSSSSTSTYDNNTVSSPPSFTNRTSLSSLLNSGDNLSLSSDTSSYQQSYLEQADSTMSSEQQQISSSEEEPSPIEIEYNKLLNDTNKLLQLLSSNQDIDDDHDSTTEDGTAKSSSSTLQLMDFDKVMTNWSRFHMVVDDYYKNNKTGTSASSYYSGHHQEEGFTYHGYNDESFKSKAYDQCLKLLNALEYNYDCIVHHHRKSSTTISEGAVVEFPNTKYTKLIPNAVSYNLTIHALSNSSSTTNNKKQGQEAFTILQRMLHKCQNYIDMVASSSDDDANSYNMKWEEEMPPKPCEPSIITYNSVIHAISKSGTNDSGYLAEQVLDSMHEWKMKCDALNNNNSSSSQVVVPVGLYKGVQPNSRTIATLIDAWSKVSPERAESILNACIDQRRKYVESITGVVVRDQHDSSIDEGTGGDLEQDVDMEEDEGGGISLDDGDVVEESIDEDLQLLVENDDLETTISGLIETEYTPASNSPLFEQQAPLFAVKPTVVVFNSCIHAWASSGKGREGAYRAQELLAQLEALSSSGELDLPTGHSSSDNSEIVTEDYYDGIDTTSSELDDDDDTLKPNVRTYSMVMNAWANVAKVERESGEDAALHCEEILEKMEKAGESDISVRPNLVAYVTSITCWARTNNVEYAASKAEHILNRMVDLYYNEHTSELPSLDGNVNKASHDAPFNSVITAYARSSDPYATERALAVLERLEASPIISPTVTTYNAVIDACAKHGEPERALEVLNKMKQMSIVPDSTSYDTVLNAFAKCEKEGSAERAYEYLCQLLEEEESNFTPSDRSYSTIINGFAKASGKNYGGIHAVQRAKEIYDKLIEQRTSGGNSNFRDTDSYANSSLLNCCANVFGTSSEKKEALVIAVSKSAKLLYCFGLICLLTCYYKSPLI